ncbi:MAG TPA: thioredoxin family protein [Kiritimatiellia bacterium]|nr:thioredoxin family protein [Kiritimatiellia bacterium]HRU71482.1 thioredoxin family protein [Kiritimatiellia bacterium]
MKTTLLMMCAAVMVAVCAQAQSGTQAEKEPKKTKGWVTDFEQAKKESATFKQPIFAFFTGSDWCGWCVRLKNEVLDTKEFEKFAADSLILFEADFPQAKKQSEKVIKQNSELANKYGVRSFPTVFLLNAEGKQLGKTGYREGGAEAYVNHLQKLLDDAGVKVEKTPVAGKAPSAYEKMKAEKAAKAAKAAEKK